VKLNCRIDIRYTLGPCNDIGEAEKIFSLHCYIGEAGKILQLADHDRLKVTRAAAAQIPGQAVLMPTAGRAAATFVSQVADIW
jgi:hypothetical protein